MGYIYNNLKEYFQRFLKILENNIYKNSMLVKEKTKLK